MQFTWNVDPIIVNLGWGLTLRYYGIIFALVFLGGFALYRWQILRAGGTLDDVYAFVLPGAIGCIVGARLGHVFFYEPLHALEDPLWILQTWKGGLASHGALIGLALAVWYWSRRVGQPFAECGDRFIFTAALGSALVRLGNFFNSEIMGRVTDQTWGVRFPRYDLLLPPDQIPLRHPSQLYEAGLGFLVLFLLLWADRRLGREQRPRGALSALFLITYFTGRFLVEFFKERQVLPSSFPLDMGQLLSIPAVAIGIIWLYRSLRRPTPAHWTTITLEVGPRGRTSRSGSDKKARKKTNGKGGSRKQ
ncbi:MAG: prolipoprotein diacylglyceryl transferase [Thermodesulfobacteriota bacterium]